MCSLFGWLDYEGIVPDRMKRKLTQALANAAEERGTDASGIAYVSSGNVVVYKRPKPAHKLHFNAPDGTKAVMGHTRMTTQGDQKFNYNNHPFGGNAGGTAFALAHNGVLYNDAGLRKENNLPKTHIETDSYIAVQLIEQQQCLDFGSLRYMAEAVHGSFCFTVLDETGKLYIIKGSNPISLVHIESLGLYVYASTDSILSKALKKVGLHKFSSLPIKLVEGQMLSIDRFGSIERSDFTPYSASKYTYGWYDFPDYDDFYGVHEQLLLGFCHCYGVDEEDVELLLDFGYTADEIEELFMDTDLLRETVIEVKRDSLCDDWFSEGEVV